MMERSRLVRAMTLAACRRNALARAMRRVQLQGGARGPMPGFLRDARGRLLHDGERAAFAPLDRLDGPEQPSLLLQLGRQGLHALDLGVQRADRSREPVGVAMLLVALADEERQAEE